MVESFEDLEGQDVVCKLCGDIHELRISSGGKPFISCREWGTNYWLNTRTAKAYLRKHVGRRAVRAAEVGEEEREEDVSAIINRVLRE